MSGSDDTYTHGHHSSVLKSHTWRTAENSAGYLLPHLDSSMHVLDVGCGPGTITCDLATHVASVIGIEPTDGILETANATATDRNVENVRFETGSVYLLHYPDASFDVVHAHQVLQHLTNPVGAIREMVRATKPGGVVAIRDADYHAMSWYPELPPLDRWMDIYQAVARKNEAEPDAARHLLEWALEADVQPSQITASVDTWLYYTDEQRAWWGDLWADRTVNSDFGTQAIEYGICTAVEQEEVAAAFREWAEHPAAWFTVPNGELLIRV